MFLGACGCLMDGRGYLMSGCDCLWVGVAVSVSVWVFLGWCGCALGGCRCLMGGWNCYMDGCGCFWVAVGLSGWL